MGERGDREEPVVTPDEWAQGLTPERRAEYLSALVRAESWGERWEWEVPIAPQPQGSMSAMVGKDGRARIFHQHSKALKDWRNAVGTMARGAHIIEASSTQPIEVEVTFRRPRAASNRGTYPVMAPDLDKYLRAVLDALTGIAYYDDAQVCRVIAGKEYGPAGATIAVRRLGQLI